MNTTQQPQLDAPHEHNLMHDYHARHAMQAVQLELANFQAVVMMLGRMQAKISWIAGYFIEFHHGQDAKAHVGDYILLDHEGTWSVATEQRFHAKYHATGAASCTHG